MTKIQQLYAALQTANGTYAASSTAAEYADAYARQSEAVQAIAATPSETLWELSLKIRAAHDIARDESTDDGHYMDGRLAVLLAAIDRDAVALARRFDELEAKIADVKVAA